MDVREPTEQQEGEAQRDGTQRADDVESGPYHGGGNPRGGDPDRDNRDLCATKEQRFAVPVRGQKPWNSGRTPSGTCERESKEDRPEFRR